MPSLAGSTAFLGLTPEFQWERLLLKMVQLILYNLDVSFDIHHILLPLFLIIRDHYYLNKYHTVI